MQSNTARLAIAGVAVAVAVVLFIVLSDSGNDDSTTTTSPTAQETATSGSGNSGGEAGGAGTTSEVPTIVIRDGQPVGGVQDLSFTQGDDIQFKVESDVADEVHFHGYDVGMDVEAGGSVTFDVPATDAGVFEVELEQRVVPIAEITVNPS